LSFVAALVAVVIWAFTGPSLHYNETWQLLINTATTILTFLMVFLLQHTQHRDGRATQLKLDELLRALRSARNELIDVENLTEEEFSKYCQEFHELHLRYAKAVPKNGNNLELKGATVQVSPEQKHALEKERERFGSGSAAASGKGRRALSEE
jgi:low affinity Fe/Cu permease